MPVSTPFLRFGAEGGSLVVVGEAVLAEGVVGGRIGTVRFVAKGGEAGVLALPMGAAGFVPARDPGLLMRHRKMF